MTRPSQGRKPLEVDYLVGANIRRLRIENHLTLMDLAKRLGCTHQQMQKYETAQNRVSAGMLHQIAGILRVRPETLFETEAPGSAASGLSRARKRCHSIIDGTTSLQTLTTMTAVLRAFRDEA